MICEHIHLKDKVIVRDIARILHELRPVYHLEKNFVIIQNSIHIILTKHQQLERYKIFNQKKKIQNNYS